MDEMELVWSPEAALDAYIDTVKVCGNSQESGIPELVSAMAAGWSASLIVETWCHGGATATSIGLAMATRRTGGRHICVVPDKESWLEYTAVMEKCGVAAEVIVGAMDTAVKGLAGVDFLVVDCRRQEFMRVLKAAKLGPRGAVLMCKNASSAVENDFQWRSVLGWRRQIVRTVFLPVGNGLDIAYIGATREDSGHNNGPYTNQAPV